MTAIVIPVRPYDHNPELRFTLRSIARYVPDPDIWMVGYQPAWVSGIRLIPNAPRGMKSHRGCQQTAAAATHPDVPASFWWWDDDMFRLTPLFGPEVRHGGPLADWVRTYTIRRSRYSHTLRRTAQYLPKNALMYDLHVPFWIDDKTALAGTMIGLPAGGWLWRTVHGNRLRLGGTGYPDVKLYGDDPIPDPPGMWLSCDDKAFCRLQPILAERFPDPSPWEVSD